MLNELGRSFFGVWTAQGDCMTKPLIAAGAYFLLSWYKRNQTEPKRAH